MWPKEFTGWRFRSPCSSRHKSQHKAEHKSPPPREYSFSARSWVAALAIKPGSWHVKSSLQG
jgi:hypothetical protein